MYNIGDLVRVVDNDKNHPHDFNKLHEYVVQDVLKDEKFKYVLKDFDFNTGIWFTEAVSENEIELVNRE